MKKALLLLAVILITATVFTACKNNTPVQAPDSVETAAVVQEVETTAEVVVTEAPTEKENVVEPVVTEEPKPVENVQKTEPVKNTKPDKTNANNTDNIITKDEAKAAALKHAGLNTSDVKRIGIELDRERNGLVYEVDFDAGKYEYEYEINAENGKVIKSEKELRD